MNAAAPAGRIDGATDVVQDRAIGDILRSLRNLTPDQVERIVVEQRARGTRFGEAAVALGFVSSDDVVFALAQQFHYPYALDERRIASPELVTLNQPFSVQAEAFRGLRAQLMTRVFDERDPRRALAVISPDAGDGKTFFAANLAVALAQLGGRTLIVDADMRGPRLHEVFNINGSAGLSGILSGRAQSQVIQQMVGIENLFVLPVGVLPPNPAELVERPAFALLMRELTGKFDHVVVDTPAGCFGADSIVIAARCGAGLAVARRNTSRVHALNELVAAVRGSGAMLAGVAMNEY